MYTLGITLYGLFDFTFDLTPLQRRKDGSAVFYKALLRTNNTLRLRSRLYSHLGRRALSTAAQT